LIQKPSASLGIAATKASVGIALAVGLLVYFKKRRRLNSA